MVQLVIKVCMKHIILFSKSSIAFHLDSWKLTLCDIKRSNQGHWFFSGLYLLNHVCYDLSLYEAYTWSYILYFSLQFYHGIQKAVHQFRFKNVEQHLLLGSGGGPKSNTQLSAAAY